jgi:hypothetical protein
MLNQILMGFVAFCILVQTSAFTGNHAQAALSQSTFSNVDSKVEIIKNAYQIFKTNLDYQLVTVEEATEKFSLEMFEKNISEDDMASFIKKYSENEDDYAEYLFSVEEAKASLSGENFTSNEFSLIAASSLANLEQDSLRWSGCSNLGVGIVLLVGAVTMGIIALAKSKSESKVEEIYAEKRADIIKDYENQVYFINNAETEIPRTIDGLYSNIINNEVALIQLRSEVEFLQLQMLTPGLPASEINSLRNQVLNIGTRMNIFQNNIVSSLNNINYFQNELSNYRADEGYAQAQLDIENTNYQASLVRNDNELANSIDNVPAEQRRAKTLGVAACVSAVIGTFMTVNGTQDC